MIRKILKSLYILLCRNYYKIFYSLTLGENSVIHRPKKLEGGKDIRIGKNSFIGSDSWLATFPVYHGVHYTPEIVIEDNVSIGRYANITAINQIIIKKGCLISEFFYTSDHTHGYDPSLGIYPAEQPLFSKGKVVIGSGCFIGFRVCVMPGVSIGKGCVIGSNSVVTKDLPDYSMAVGVPAKVIKKYNFDNKSWENTIE